MPKQFLVFGLGFGDCGKGHFVDALCAREPIDFIIRYNGGGQAGHTVVLDDGREHIFSQLGAGSFSPHIKTVLAKPFVLHPLGLLKEAQQLQEKNCTQALERLLIDERCRVTTPWLQIAGQLEEAARGAQAHGSCGLGFGKTVELSLTHPSLTLYYGDLINSSLSLQKLHQQQEFFHTHFAQYPDWVKACADKALNQRWLVNARALLHYAQPLSPSIIRQSLSNSAGIVYEGAQGILLDEDYGFHPHTTWSSTGPHAAQRVAHDYHLDNTIIRYGALRSYLTRHGAGPFPSYDATLNHLAEPHNLDTGHQGAFRRGHFDEVLLHYALHCSGPIDGLLISHLDTLETMPKQWCHRYQGEQQLPLHPKQGLDLQYELTQQLFQAQPEFASIASVQDFLMRLEQSTSIPIIAKSYGPRRQDIHWTTES